MLSKQMKCLFISMIHVFLDGVKLQSTYFWASWNFFHIELARLTFSFMQVGLYVAMGRAFMCWGSIPPYNFLETNILLFTKDLIKNESL